MLYFLLFILLMEISSIQIISHDAKKATYKDSKNLNSNTNGRSPGRIAEDSITNWTAIGVADYYGAFLDDSQRLFDELFFYRRYQSDMSPVYSLRKINDTAIPRFHVQVAVQYAQLMGLDVQSQLMYTLLELEFIWQDVRLAWNPEDFGGIEKTWVNYEMLWIPQNGFANAQHLEIINPDKTVVATIFANGTVVLGFYAYVQTGCEMEVGRFPFDSQMCSVDFYVSAYEYYYVEQKGALFTKYDDLNVLGNGTWKYDDYNIQGNGEWAVQNLSMSTKFFCRNERFFCYDYLKFLFYLKREANFYVYVIAVPCFLLTLLSIVGMFWTPNLKEEQLTKLSIGLTSMMSMTIFVDLMASQIPKTSSFPLLGVFVVTSVFIISCACVVLVTTSVPPSWAKRRESKSCPETLRNFFCSIHFFLLALFQSINIANFVVLMSFWH